MVYAHDVYGMVQMADEGVYRGLLTVLGEESVVQCYLHHSASRREGTHLVVGEIARMVAQRAAAAVAAYDRCRGQLQGLVERCLSGMGEVDHDAEAVHLAYDISPE